VDWVEQRARSLQEVLLELEVSVSPFAVPLDLTLYSTTGAEGADNIHELRRLVAENPDLLQHVVQGIVANNPQLAAQINQNPEMLYQLLAGGDDEGDLEGMEGAGPPGTTTIALTQEEMDAIQRVGISPRLFHGAHLSIVTSFGVFTTAGSRGVSCMR
jgi:XPC-binding domain